MAGFPRPPTRSWRLVVYGTDDERQLRLVQQHLNLRDPLGDHIQLAGTVGRRQQSAETREQRLDIKLRLERMDLRRHSHVHHAVGEVDGGLGLIQPRAHLKPPLLVALHDHESRLRLPELLQHSEDGADRWQGDLHSHWLRLSLVRLPSLLRYHRNGYVMVAVRLAHLHQEMRLLQSRRLVRLVEQLPSHVTLCLGEDVHQLVDLYFQHDERDVLREGKEGLSVSEWPPALSDSALCSSIASPLIFMPTLKRQIAATVLKYRDTFSTLPWSAIVHENRIGKVR
ncbi:hypothetical protein PMAYCL1PPCAC_10080 [Pristionchus mayeri]|uniref:Uncharacterized protein n=1 Tax=Pristionchus mayeri TaxID=1317129 RepID=A0AAN4ZMS9_9BILA|nr:hypothetical protein PMAYCL1PPCAC_10080 [Pristionchus mayeri]